MYDSVGYLRVRSFTAGGAIPIEGAVIRLHGADEENYELFRSVITDRDGVGFFKELPTPNVSFSLSPRPQESPYALYDLEITAEGYDPQIIKGVQVFPGIESYQPINLIPKTSIQQ